MNHRDLAKLCQKVYNPETMLGVTLIGDVNVLYCVVIREIGEPTVVVFPGTRNFAGLLSDVDVLWQTTTNGPVHKGFWRAWDLIREALKREVRGDSRIILTGHSLGGALATLAAMEITADEIVTFGCPRVGGEEFAAIYANGLVQKTTRYVWNLDPVPWLPGWLSGFRHVCPVKWHDGEWKDAYDWWSLAKLLGHMAVNLFMDGGNWMAWINRLRADHQIEKYVGGVK